MFLPTTKEEVIKRGWDKLDIIIVTGDTYIDSPYIGAAVIGQLLAKKGYRIGIIAQPDITSNNDITRLGEPELFWGVTAGSVDSMVANYTPSKKFRKEDDFTPGGVNNRRPDRATITYSNLIRRYFPAIRRDSASPLRKTNPIVLGGIEASLRRVAHYDYWDNAIRRSILFDAKADILIYGMAEKATLQLADRLKNGQDYKDIRGLCYIAPEPKAEFIVLPSYEEVKPGALSNCHCERPEEAKQSHQVEIASSSDIHRSPRNDINNFIEAFTTFYDNNDPITAKGLCQKQDTRYLIQNPPAEHLTTKELDEIYELDYENDVHPYYKRMGKVRAMDTIKFSITSHRGCYGECNFCAIAVHQGRTVISRSPESIIREATRMTRHKDFNGHIHDVGGPTANMYAIECDRKLKSGACKDKRCIYPEPCKALKINHRPQTELLRQLRRIKGIKKVFIGSGLRHDMVMADAKHGIEYLEELVNHHISGQLKIAPEHTEPKVLDLMGKPDAGSLKRFRSEFNRLNKQKQFLTYYLIAAHPGCDDRDMLRLNDFVRQELKMTPEQVQIFTPTPSTYSTLMYYTGIDPFTPLEMSKITLNKLNAFNKDNSKEILSHSSERSSRKDDLSLTGFTGKEIFVEKDLRGKERQKGIIITTKTQSHP